MRMTIPRWVGSGWNCPNCEAILEFDSGRRTAVAFLAAILGVAPAVYFARAGVWWAGVLAVAAFAFIWSFDSVRLREPSTGASASSSQ
jgi:hypothetical protein